MGGLFNVANQLVQALGDHFPMEMMRFAAILIQKKRVLCQVPFVVNQFHSLPLSPAWKAAALVRFVMPVCGIPIRRRVTRFYILQAVLEGEKRGRGRLQLGPGSSPG